MKNWVAEGIASDVNDFIQEAPKNFSWLIVNDIAGCAMINSEFELLWLKNIGIKHILCLNKDHKAWYIFEEIVEFQGAK